MSATDRFVTGGAATWPVKGSAVASLGLARVEVADTPAALSGADFSADVEVAPGLTLVPVVARDQAGNERKAHRSLMSAAFIPEGAFVRDAASIVLTETVLAEMAGSLAGDAADIDVAAQVMARDTLSVDDRCVTWPVYAEQDPTAVELHLDGADLWLEVVVPNLYVYFEGECEGLIQIIPIAGEMAMTIDTWSQLDARDSGACVTGFDHSEPEVFLDGFYFDVWGAAGPLSGWMVELASSGKAEEAHDQFQAEFTAQADELLGEGLSDLAVFDRREAMALLGQEVDVHLCLGELSEVGDTLVARIASEASGGGTRAAPGAPQMGPVTGGALVVAGPGELVLDADFIARLLFSSWRAGGLDKADVQTVDFGLLSLLARDLEGRYPADALVSVSISGELPPLVTTSPVADLRIELADVMLDLVIEGERLFRLNARLTLDLDLVPDAGELVPTVVAVESEVHLVDEIVDAPDGALESAVQGKLSDSAESLLGGARLALPAIPGLGAPMDVTADPGGRWLHIIMQ